MRRELDKLDKASELASSLNEDQVRALIAISRILNINDSVDATPDLFTPLNADELAALRAKPKG